MLREGSLGRHGCQRDFKKIKKGDDSKVTLCVRFHEDVEASRGRECVSPQSLQNSRNHS